jgi:hypothetical protein
MVEPLHQWDALDIATGSYWRPPQLSEQLSHVEPWAEQESFAIPDLTDQEWEAFTKALHER